MNLLGYHYIIDIEIESFDQLNSLDFIKNVCLKLIKLMKLTYLGEITHIFEPQGISLIILLAESHISYHSYPELLKASLDIYSCKKEKMKKEEIIDCLNESMKIKNINCKVISRII